MWAWSEGKWVRVVAYGSDVESNMEWVWNALRRCDGDFGFRIRLEEGKGIREVDR